MRVKNLHTAGLESIAPGEVGELNEKNAAVAAWLAAGLLVPAEEKPVESSSFADDGSKKRKG